MKYRFSVRVLASLLSLLLMIGLLPMTAFAAEIAPPADGNFTLLWTTDPQWYSFAYPEIIQHQNQWVKDNFQRLDIRYVLHTGDLVDNPHNHTQWAVMDEAYKIWDDLDLAYGLLAGNHDVDGADHTEFSQYFGKSRYDMNWWYGGDYDDNFGHYDLMTIDGVEFIFVYLGYGDHEQAAYDWMNSVLKQYPNRIAILNFHEYLAATGQRTARGNTIFNEVVLKNPNVRIVQCGHNYNSTRLVEEIDDNGDGKADRTVYQIMANYQSTTKGGNGFMRFMECDVQNGVIMHRTYSPYTQAFGSDYETWEVIDEYGTRDMFVTPFDFSAPTAKGAGDPEVGTVVKTQEMSFAPTDTLSAVTLPVVYQNEAENGATYRGVGVYDRFFSPDAADAFSNPKTLNYVYATYASGGYTVSKVVKGAALGTAKPLVPTTSDTVVIALPADAPVNLDELTVGRKVMLNKLNGIHTPTAQKSVSLTVPSWGVTYNIDGINRLAGNDEWVIIDRLCEVKYTHEWDMLYLFQPVSGSTYQVTDVNTTLGTAKDLYIYEGSFLLAVNTCSAGTPFVPTMASLFKSGLQVTLNGHVPGEPPVGTVKNLLAPSVSDWSRDTTLLTVEQTADAQVLYNTNSQWPDATYTYPTPITVDPSAMAIHYDYMIETGAQTNIQLHFATSTPTTPVSNQYVRIHKYFDGAYISSNSGDAKGDDVRRSGYIHLTNVDIPADCYNADGTLTLNGITITVAGSAQKKEYYYDFSLRTNVTVDDNSLPQNMSLQSGDITVTDDKLEGGYTYDNGRLTVTADSDSGYALTMAVNRSFHVTVLKNWLVNASSTTAFDVQMTVTTAGGDATYGLAPDFWPGLCEGTVNGCLPAGTYNKALNLYSCYEFNGVIPADGITTVKTVTIKLDGKGTLTLDALQMSNGSAAGRFADGVVKSVKTPAYILGDVSGDKDITTTDARMAMLHALESYTLEGNMFLAADFNTDGEVTTLDARLIMLHALTH